MGLNIKNAATENAIRELAARTGESLTDAVNNAVEEKLTRLDLENAPIRPAKTLEEFFEAVRPFQDQIAQARRNDPRPLRDLMDDLYDEHGLSK